MSPLLPIPGLRSLVAWAVPEHFDSDQRWRASLLVQFCVTGAMTILVYPLLHLVVYDLPLTATVSGLGLLLLGLVPVLLRASANLTAASYAFALVTVATVMMVAGPIDGVRSFSLAWLGMVVLCATTTGGTGAGLFALFCTLVGLVVVFSGDHLEWWPVATLSHDLAVLSGLVNTTLLAWLGLTLGDVWLRAHRRALIESTRAQANLLELEAMAARAERLASVGTLATGIAHEINNPLTWVAANLEALRPMVKDRPQAYELLRDGRDGVRRVAGIVRQLQTFARGEDDAIGPSDALRALDAALQITESQLFQRAHVVRQLQAIPTVLGSETRLVQVFVNLLTNAVQALHEPGGTIVLRSGIMDPDHAWIEIEDDGEGIDEHQIERIFEPFFTTRAIGEGTGLGLSICHGLLQRMGGEIQASSIPGHGTRMRVILRTTEMTSTPVPLQDSDGEADEPARHLNILIIDDEAMVRRALARLLGVHQVHTAESIEMAMTMLPDLGELDVILCDLMMPGIPGWELPQVLQEHRPELIRRVVYMTGGAFTNQARSFVDALKTPVLAKPLTPKDLMWAIDEVVSGTAEPTP